MHVCVVCAKCLVLLLLLSFFFFLFLPWVHIMWSLLDSSHSASLKQVVKCSVFLSQSGLNLLICLYLFCALGMSVHLGWISKGIKNPNKRRQTRQGISKPCSCSLLLHQGVQNYLSYSKHHPHCTAYGGTWMHQVGKEDYTASFGVPVVQCQRPERGWWCGSDGWCWMLHGVLWGCGHHVPVFPGSLLSPLGGPTLHSTFPPSSGQLTPESDKTGEEEKALSSSPDKIALVGRGMFSILWGFSG